MKFAMRLNLAYENQHVARFDKPGFFDGGNGFENGGFRIVGVKIHLESADTP